MRLLCLIFVFLGHMIAAHIGEIKTYSQGQYNDVFLLLQSPLKKQVKLSYDRKKSVYFIENLSSKEVYYKFLEGPLKSVVINSKANTLYIKPIARGDYILDLTPSNDKQILRLRFKTKEVKEQKNNTSGYVGVSLWQYIVVLSFVIVLIAVLFVVQYRLKKIKRLNPQIKVEYHPIDGRTRIVAIEFNNNCYVVLENNKNYLLLDRVVLGSGRPKNQKK